MCTYVYLQLGLQTRLELVRRCQRFCQQRVKQETELHGFIQLKQEVEIYYKHLKILCSSGIENVVSKYSIDKVHTIVIVYSRST